MEFILLLWTSACYILGFWTDFGAKGEESLDTSDQNVDISQEAKKSKNLSNNERQAIYIALLQRSIDGKLKRDTTKIVASIFGVSIRTVQRIWKQSKSNSNSGVIDVSHRRTKNCGRKRIQLDFEQIQEIPLSRRTTLDSLSCALNVSKTTLFRNLKLGNIRRHSNAIKPFLKEENKRTRLQFCISMLEENTLPHDPTFVDMYNVVHIDEKWFYMTKKIRDLLSSSR